MIRNTLLGVLLLLALSVSTVFAGQGSEPPSYEADSNARADSPGIVISEPSDGRSFSSGESVHVSVEAVPPFRAQSVALLSEFGVMEDTSAPFEFVLKIPVDFVGRSTISAVGKNNAGDFSDGRTIEIIVEASASLTGISISPRNIYLNGLNDRRQLRVFGQYTDGNERDVLESAEGVSFVSSNPSILSVSESGMLVPKAGGTATITARSGGFEDAISVEVLNAEK